jgi:hypothetical protein
MILWDYMGCIWDLMGSIGNPSLMERAKLIWNYGLAMIWFIVDTLKQV